MKINIYHQNIKGDNKPSKDLYTLVYTVQKDKELLRENYRLFLHSIKKIAIENCRETSQGDIIEIMPFDTCSVCEIGQFIIEEDGYRRIDWLIKDIQKYIIIDDPIKEVKPTREQLDEAIKGIKNSHFLKWVANSGRLPVDPPKFMRDFMEELKDEDPTKKKVLHVKKLGE